MQNHYRRTIFKIYGARLERGETKYALFRLEEAREKLFGEIKELIERVKNEKRESCLIYKNFLDTKRSLLSNQASALIQ